MPDNAGPFGGDVDPADSDSLRRLREIIDTEIGWNSEDDEEGGDYERRLRDVAAELRRLRGLPSVRERLRAAVDRLDALINGPAPVDFDAAATRARETEERRG